MKKFSLLMIALLCAVVTFAAGEKKQFEALPFTPAKASVQLSKQFNAKQAPAALAKKMQKTAKAKARAPRRAVAAADLAGDYQWDYLQSSETSTDLESLTTTAGSSHAVISVSETTEGGITISGMFSNDLEATVASDDLGDYFVIEGGQIAGTSSYGDYVLYGLFYYEGDEDYEAGWYYQDIYCFLEEDGTITIDSWLVRVLSGGDYDGYSLTPYYVEGSTLTPADPLAPIALPEGVEAVDYVMTYDGGSTPVKVALDGNDVYIQGMSYYIPDAWVKGTKEGDQVTFAAMQYMGEYGTYGSSYFFYNGETVFTYDAEADTYTAEGQVFGVLADRYYDGNYTNPVIGPVVEKAVMPADPEITALTQSSAGWYFDFDVPIVDVNGDGLVTSKLSYMIYTDIEGEIAPLTFTPETHSNLNEDMTEIPYGFTEDWDFYDTRIYLNELYSADWNNIGIQSIYRGGDEVNATEIQWYPIKEYAVTYGLFNFNEMDVATSTNASTDGDITADTTIVRGHVDLTITKATGSTSNRFWGTKSGPQLRVYSGTLTFTVPEGYEITGIDFSNNSKWNEGNSADCGKLDGTTWTGNAQTVVVTIAGNTQLNAINVTVEAVNYELVELPEGVEAEAWAIEGFYSTDESGSDVLRSAEVAIDGNDIYVKGLAYYFDDAWLKGTIEDGIATFPGGQFVGEDDYGKEFMNGYGVDGNIGDIQYVYDAEAKTLTQATPFVLECGSKSGYNEDGELDVWGWWEVSNLHAGEPLEKVAVEVPEGLETESYLFTANEIVEEEEESDDDAGYARRAITNTDVTFDFNAMDDVVVSSNESNAGDITETLVLTEGDVTLSVSPKSESASTPNRFWGTNAGPQLRVYSGTLTFEVPEGSTMTQIVFNNSKWNAGNAADSGDFDGSTWTGDAQTVVVSIAANTQLNNIVVTVKSGSEEEPVVEETNYSFQIQAGFDGQDVYFKGFTENTADMWFKGTLSEDGKTVTIPANQYMGTLSTFFSDYDFHITALNLNYVPEDIVFNYDAETGTFTTEQTIITNGSMFVTYPYQTFTDVVITKIEEFAATPADPSIESYKLESTSYPYMEFNIPAKDVDGNDILTTKLFYTVWIEKDGEEQPFILSADEYKNIDEDITEVPYEFDDSYDIYRAGSRFYLNPAEDVTKWTKIGIQSIYYGGDECNKSNIVWMENPVYDVTTTGIANVNVDVKDAVIFDLQGRRVMAPAKGLYIVNGKKVVLK